MQSHITKDTDIFKNIIIAAFRGDFTAMQHVLEHIDATMPPVNNESDSQNAMDINKLNLLNKYIEAELSKGTDLTRGMAFMLRGHLYARGLDIRDAKTQTPKGRYQLAMAQYEQALQLGNIDALCLQGELFRQFGKLDQAIKTFNNNRLRKHTRALYQLVLTNEKKVGKVCNVLMGECRDAVRFFNNDANIFFKLGHFYKEKIESKFDIEEGEKAVEFFRKAKKFFVTQKNQNLCTQELQTLQRLYSQNTFQQDYYKINYHLVLSLGLSLDNIQIEWDPPLTLKDYVRNIDSTVNFNYHLSQLFLMTANDPLLSPAEREKYLTEFAVDWQINPPRGPEHINKYCVKIAPLYLNKILETDTAAFNVANLDVKDASPRMRRRVLSSTLFSAFSMPSNNQLISIWLNWMIDFPLSMQVQVSCKSIYLMLTPESGTYKNSNDYEIFLYKNKEGEIIYQINNKIYNLQDRNEQLPQHIKELKFDQPERYPASFKVHEICEAILQITAKRRHTNYKEDPSGYWILDWVDEKLKEKEINYERILYILNFFVVHKKTPEQARVNCKNMMQIIMSLKNPVTQELPAVSIDSKFKINSDSFTIGELISTSAFGIVYRGTWRKQNEIVDVVIKYTIKAREIQIMTKQHPNIVTLLGYWGEKNFYIIMESMSKGSLYDILKSKQILAWDVIISIAKDIACGLAFLHQEKILHCDLVSRNILIGKNYEAKIGDFGESLIGLTRFMYTSKSNDKIRTAYPYKAPELDLSDLLSIYTQKTDIYNYGLILVDMVSDKLPQEILDFKKIKPGCPEKLSSLIAACIEEDPDKRPDAEMIKIYFESHYTNFHTFLASKLVAETQCDNKQSNSKLSIVGR